MDFNHKEVEKRCKAFWADNETYKVSIDPSKPKFYVLDMFPYPSGAGLHVGHPLGYIASDIYARYKRQTGFNVLHPMGYDAFGLPAEQYAIQTGVHPADSTDKNIKMYRAQLDNIGFNYDWDRQVKTCDPSYYKWTQWIFIKLFEHYYDTGEKKAKPISELIKLFGEGGSASVKASHANETDFSAEEWSQMTAKAKDEILMNYRLAFRKVAYVNWCEALGTVLANDEVKDGLSERGGHPVEKRPMMQWALRITAYAERLLEGLNKLDWSESMKTMQRNWIGKSTGAQVFFQLADSDDKIEVFTTRPDTIFGVSFMVLAPEHDLVASICTDEQKSAIAAYVTEAGKKSEIERMAEGKTVSGCFTGAYALHPFTQKKIPIYISDYVLKDYGTGAIMAVPADDARDRKFAEKFDLEIVEIVDKSGYPDAGIGDKVGVMINSDFLNGLKVKDAIKESAKQLYDHGIGKRYTNYRLRDANFSRQRYWGEPFPIKIKDGVSVAESFDNLPVELPSLDDFKPTAEGKSPLAKVTDWVNTPDGTRETDIMPGYAGSSWYFFRYMDALNNQSFASQKALDYWQDVDLYIGGTEHAVGHLMYSRFWTKFLFDIGEVRVEEPFKKLINQGMIQGVIEYIYLAKEKTNGRSKFVCSKIAQQQGVDNFSKLPIHVDFVEDYGSHNSYINRAGIEAFIQWRPEYKDAIYECGLGTYDMGSFKSKSDATDSMLYTESEVGKMSKRYFNVVNPDTIVERYGADCFRMYEMFLGPIEQSKPWDTQGIEGVAKFIKRLWSLYYTDGEWRVTNDSPNKVELKALHAAIKKIRKDLEAFSFNTCISQFMMLVNELKKQNTSSEVILKDLVRLIAPFAPFLAEELWSKLGHEHSVHHSEYPEFQESYLVEDTITYPICVNGKKRSLLKVANGLAKEEIEKMAKELPDLDRWLDGKQVVKIIVVPNKMVNFVVK